MKRFMLLEVNKSFNYTEIKLWSWNSGGRRNWFESKKKGAGEVLSRMQILEKQWLMACKRAACINHYKTFLFSN